WRLFLQLRRFQGQLPWLLGWVCARARSSSVKLETVVPRGRWMRLEKRRTLRRVYKPSPLPTRYLSRNRRDVSYRQLSIFRILATRNLKAYPNLFMCTAYLRRNIALVGSRLRMQALSRRSLDAQPN